DPPGRLPLGALLLRGPGPERSRRGGQRRGGLPAFLPRHASPGGSIWLLRPGRPGFSRRPTGRPTSSRRWRRPARPSAWRPRVRGWLDWHGEVQAVQHIAGKRPLGRHVDQLEVGEKATFTQRVEERDVYLYMGLTNDLNPIYVDRDYAQRTDAGEPVVPGILLAAQVVAAITSELPGPGTIT